MAYEIGNIEDLANRFTHHPPKGNQSQTYEDIRKEALAFALYLKTLCPPSRELSLAITRLEEVVFWANAGLSRHG